MCIMLFIATAFQALKVATFFGTVLMCPKKNTFLGFFFALCG